MKTISIIISLITGLFIALPSEESSPMVEVDNPQYFPIEKQIEKHSRDVELIKSEVKITLTEVSIKLNRNSKWQ